MSYPPRDLDRHAKPITPTYRSSLLRGPTQKRIHMPVTRSEETGPVFGHDLIGAGDANLIENFASAGQTAIGPRIIVHGVVRDEQGRPVPDTLIEVWQANAGGRYRHAKESYLAPLDPNFGGCGRCMTDAEGRYEFWTVQPGPYPWPNGANDWRPAHIHFSLFGASFAQRLITQMYFEGDPMVWLCPIVGTIESEDAVRSLISRLDMERTVPFDARAYEFNITLRGRDQTFFEGGS